MQTSAVVVVLLITIQFYGLVELAPTGEFGQFHLPSTYSRPILSQQGQTSSEVWTTSSQPNGDYVSDEDLQQVIDRLDMEDQFASQWRDRFRDDFVDDHEHIDEINDKIEQSILDQSIIEAGQDTDRPHNNHIDIDDNGHIDVGNNQHREPEGSTEEICPVCLEELSSGDITAFRCGHKLHINCKNELIDNVSIFDII